MLCARSAKIRWTNSWRNASKSITKYCKVTKILKNRLKTSKHWKEINLSSTTKRGQARLKAVVWWPVNRRWEPLEWAGPLLHEGSEHEDWSDKRKGRISLGRLRWLSYLREGGKRATNWSELVIMNTAWRRLSGPRTPHRDTTGMGKRPAKSDKPDSLRGRRTHRKSRLTKIGGEVKQRIAVLQRA